MRVSVTLHGRLAEEPEAAGRREGGSLDLAEGAVAADVARACGIDPRACVVVVNGAAVTAATALSDGSRVTLYSAQAGG
jgi:sulfur carrier protein ThiS